ncbi:SDR family NAD(P)-dependent oxidoreductase [Prauserella alba]|uniref:SDR family oxidoreductase n=1 Tax=Prauserella alba TaxID=176898 RepID=A0ABN1VNF8_9PSEU|nr:SDR family oxidoreductase [Prauserella alba]MCP2180676.1 NAD(P)-dependent dehydrogenase, short-chain alcohol dehydrogenase family [Prauserella alba]
MTEGSRLAGRTALVFGGGGGPDGATNGQAAALTYARHGASVAVVDVSGEAAGHTVEAIRAEGGAATAITADVTDGDQVADAVGRAAETFGPADILHNNVGVTVLGGPMDLSLEEWHRAFALNVDGVFLACKHVLPAMLNRGGGAIVNVSSLAALRHVGYDYPAYMAAKAAVNQATVSLALTYAARGIRANSVAPGFIETPLVRQQLASQAGSLDELMAARHAASPTGRMGTPWDVANASLFLASDEAAYVNGVCLPVDGGLAMTCAPG